MVKTGAPGAKHRSVRSTAYILGASLLLLFIPSTTHGIVLGDANRDGVVSIADVPLLLRIINGDAPGTFSADANQDGFILSDDVTETIAMLFGRGLAGATPTATATESRTPPLGTATASRTPSGPATATATGSQTAAATQTATAPPTPSSSPLPTASPSPSPTPAVPTATPSGGADAALAVAGSGIGTASAMNAIPPLITAIVSGFEFGSATLAGAALSDAIGGSAGAGACPLNGTVARACTGVGNVTVTFTFSDCTLPSATGSLHIDGTVTLSGTGFCPNVLPPFSTTTNVQATFRNPGDQTLVIATANLTGSVTPQLGGSCTVTGGTLLLSGTIASRIPGQVRSSLELTSTTVGVNVRMFDSNCAPVGLALTFNGPGVLSQTSGGAAGARGAAPESASLTFTDFVLDQDSSSNPSRTRLDGGITAQCFGGMVTLATQAPLTQAVGMPCPSDGRIRVTSPAATAQILYLADGRVALDTTLDGVGDSTFDSCVDPALLLCVGAPAATPTASRTPTVSRTATPSATSGSASPPPSSTATHTATAFATATATATGTRTATVAASSTPTTTGTRTATVAPSPTPTATSGLPPERFFCNTTQATIPDNTVAGVASTMTVTDAVSISDLNVRVDVNHTFIGDLVISLTHVETGRVAVLVERPGASVENTFGCENNDISLTFDNQASRFAQSSCFPFSPAIRGSVIPDGSLDTFNGESAAGTWQLRVSDRSPQDTGALLSWCLEVNSRAPVVTAFTCNGETDCTLPLGQAYTLAFRVRDVDGNAVSWQIKARDDTGVVFDFAAGTFDTPTGDGMRTVQSPGFTCQGGGCRTTQFEFFVVVTDAGGHVSPLATVDITSLGSAADAAP